MVRRLVKQREIRLREDDRGERRLRRCLQPGAAERSGKARLRCPVGCCPGIRLARCGAAEVCQRSAHCKQVCERFGAAVCKILAQDAGFGIPGDFTGGGRGPSPRTRSSRVDLPMPFRPTGPVRS